MIIILPIMFAAFSFNVFAQNDVTENLAIREMEIKNAAMDSESILMRQILQQMFEKINENSTFGFSSAEKIFQEMLIPHYAESISDKGGVGIAQHVMKNIKSKDHRYICLFNALEAKYGTAQTK